MLNNKCVIIPKVKNSEGQLIESKLFKDLLSSTNSREDAVKLYLLTKDSTFISNYGNKLTYDENNEVTLSSLTKAINIEATINNEKLMEQLNKDIGAYKKDNTLRRYINEDDVFEKVKNFNKTNPYNDRFVASYVKTYSRVDDYIYWTIRVQPKTSFNSINSDKQEYNYILNQKIREILSNYNVSIGALTNLEKRMEIAGVMDTSQALTATNGIIELIRLADGIRGEKALPEEFAHFIVEALGNDPLVNRMVNSVQPFIEELLGEDYNEYNSLYKGDTNLLGKEAVGKLLASHFLNNTPIEDSSYNNLFKRLLQKIKEFLKSINTNQLQRAKNDANQLFGQVANDILEGQLDHIINVNNIERPTKLYNVEQRVSRDKELLKNIIETESKRLNIYKQRNPNSTFEERQSSLINELEQSLEDNREIEGIYNFLDNALKELNAVNSRLNQLYENKDKVGNINETASTLRNTRNYLSAYSGILNDIKSTIRDDKRENTNRYKDKLIARLNEVSTLLDYLNTDYSKIGIPLFVQFLKPFIGDSLNIPFGKFKGQTMKIEELLKVADKDISFFDRWLDSMADSSDPILKMMDVATKRSKELARLRTIELMKKIQLAQATLEKSGVKNTEWMLEKDSNGKNTGNYIGPVNYEEFYKNRKKMLEELNQRFPNPTPDQVLLIQSEKNKWIKENAIKNEDNRLEPNPIKYASKAFNSLNQAQREYYDTIISIKKELDNLLPDKYTYNRKAIQIRKDLVERVKSSESVKQGSSFIWENIKDQFLRRVDDTDFGTKSTLIDFEGNEVQLLPIYFTHKLEDLDLLSGDISSTMTAYASMAIDFDEMNKVIDTMELGRDLLRDRKVIQTEGGIPKLERFKVLGRSVESKLLRKGNESRIVERLDDFFRMQIYGQYQADEGVINILGQPIDKGKLANFVNKMTSLNSFALNLLAGIANVGMGTMMMNTEAIAGEYFNSKDVAIADKNYTLNMPQFMAELGNRIKTSKLSLWNELFNTMQEFEQDVREVDNTRKTWFSRFFSMGSLFFINNAGEHWMQTRTSLAVANTYKMKDKNGKIVTLWEAMEVVPINPSNPNQGGKLRVKEGYTKEDGSEFTKDDIIEFSNRVKAINQRMHGIYNKADKNAFQRLAIGRMAMMFRKWMKPAVNRRFSSPNYNHDLGTWSEGYYVTTTKFLWQVVQDIRKSQFQLASRWNEMSKHERANIIRSVTEAGHLIALALLLGLIEWTDDKDRPWAVKMAEYQLRRLQTELGALVPGPQMIEEATTIIKSPAAGVDYMERVLRLGKVWNYFDEIESGRYKGHTKFYRNFMETLPLNKPIYKALNPEESLQFYKMN